MGCLYRILQKPVTADGSQLLLAINLIHYLQDSYREILLIRTKNQFIKKTLNCCKSCILTVVLLYTQISNIVSLFIKLLCLKFEFTFSSSILPNIPCPSKRFSSLGIIYLSSLIYFYNNLFLWSYLANWNQTWPQSSWIIVNKIKIEQKISAPYIKHQLLVYPPSWKSQKYPR